MCTNVYFYVWRIIHTYANVYHMACLNYVHVHACVYGCIWQVHACKRNHSKRLLIKNQDTCLTCTQNEMSIPPLSWHYASPKKCIDKWTTSDVKISLNDSYTIGEAPSYMHFIQYTCSMYMHLHVRIRTCSYMYQVECHVISFIHHFNTPLQTLRVIQNYSLPPSSLP